MATIDLKVELRETVGKKATKEVRRAGKIPGILYGRNVKPTPLAVDLKELFRVTHTKAGANALLSLKIEGARAPKGMTCLIKEASRDPVTDEIEHVDFAAVSLTEKIKVKVPLVVRDTEASLGIKEGGILDVVHHEIEVECLPTEIPERIEANVKELKIGESIHLKDLAIPQGAVPLLDPEEVVIALHPPRKEEEIAPPPEEGATEPEVIEKGKKEKAEEEAAEAAPAAKKGEKKPAEQAEKKPEKTEEKK